MQAEAMRRLADTVWWVTPAIFTALGFLIIAVPSSVLLSLRDFRRSKRAKQQQEMQAHSVEIEAQDGGGYRVIE